MSAAGITLWGRRNSMNVQKVAWALAELGLDWTHVSVGGSLGGADDPAYLAMNPNGLVPTLRDGDLTLWESDAILRYLARRYGAGTLWPADDGAAALADQWSTWAATTLHPAMRPLFGATVRTPRAEQDFSGLGPAAARLAATMAILDAALAGRDWLAGGRFSFGDIAPAVVARRALLLPFGAPQAANVGRWLTAIGARPGFARHVDIPIGASLEEWRDNERAFG